MQIFNSRQSLLSAMLALLLVSTIHSAPVVTCENFNELTNAYQQGVNNAAIKGMPVGVTANFAWNCQLMWGPGVNPPGSAATNNVEVGWTPATPAVTFSSPVILWTVSAFKKWDNTLSLVGKRNGAVVWTYTNSDPANTWFQVPSGWGKAIDSLDVDCNSWGVKLTDFYLSDASKLSPYTNTSPFYVDGSNPAASDYNPGTEAQPWKTIQWAASYLQAGDTVYIKRGVYSGAVYAGNSGNATNGWITYSAYPGHEQQAILDQSSFNVFQKSYIKISGLKIQNVVGGGGIYVVGPGGNYVISGNYVYNTSESGIAVWGVPYGQDPGIYDYRAITNVIMESNIVERACNGGYDEQMDIANGVDNFEIRFNTVKNGTNNVTGGEGIDTKEGASNGKIYGNQLYNLRKYAIYIEAGGSNPDYYKIRPGVLTNIEIFDNVIHNSDSHGIGITSEGRGNIDGIKVYNNLCYSNGCDGILLYDYGYTSDMNYARNITIVNNTTYNNNASTTTPWYGGIATDHKYAQNVIVRNNLCFETLHGGFAIKQPYNPATVMDHNLASTTTNPGFRNVSLGDFHLQAASPAINAGSPLGAPLTDFDGSVRPNGNGFDLGAFEYFPASPVSMGIQGGRLGTNTTLTLRGGPGSHYRVEWKSSLTNHTWTLLQDISALPRCPYTVSDTNGASATAQRFYRAVLQTP